MMRNAFLSMGAVLAVAGLVACGQTKEVSGQAAIDHSQTLKTTQEKTDYLVSQAKAFYNSKQFQDAVNVSQYVLSALDRDSTAARDILEKAKADLMTAGKAKADEVKKQFGF